MKGHAVFFPNRKKMIKLVVFCVLCLAVYFLYPYALYTPEQRYLRAKCTRGKVCVLPDDQQVVTEKFTAHEPKIAHFVYEDLADVNDTSLATFEDMFGSDVWKVVRKYHRTEREKIYGPAHAHPSYVEYWNNDRMLWKQRLLSKQMPQQDAIVQQQQPDYHAIEWIKKHEPRLPPHVEKDGGDVDSRGDAPQPVGIGEEAQPQVQIDRERERADPSENHQLSPRIGNDEQVE